MKHETLRSFSYPPFPAISFLHTQGNAGLIKTSYATRLQSDPFETSSPNVLFTKDCPLAELRDHGGEGQLNVPLLPEGVRVNRHVLSSDADYYWRVFLQAGSPKALDLFLPGLSPIAHFFIFVIFEP